MTFLDGDEQTIASRTDFSIRRQRHAYFSTIPFQGFNLAGDF
tara:strand:- start:66 stop:191 length:126 start_codon:yes stop_codon:yes gene_type:complete